MDINQIEAAIAAMRDAFQVIQQPRSDFQIEHFVVGEKETEPAAYAQCILELQIKYNAIRRARLHKQKLALEIEQLRGMGDSISEIEADLKEIDGEDCELALLGAMREFECLYRLWHSFPKKYDYAELQDAQEGYWHKRIVRQAEQDIAATGSIGVGNQDALRQIGLGMPVVVNGRRAYPIGADKKDLEVLTLPQGELNL